MKQSIKASWKGDLAFETELNGHKLEMDASEEGGGHDLGPRPKILMLAALVGCTGMDVVSILGKMRVPVDKCDVHVEANMTDEHPKQYDKMHVIYFRRKSWNGLWFAIWWFTWQICTCDYQNFLNWWNDLPI